MLQEEVLRCAVKRLMYGKDIEVVEKFDGFMESLLSVRMEWALKFMEYVLRELSSLEGRVSTRNYLLRSLRVVERAFYWLIRMGFVEDAATVFRRMFLSLLREKVFEIFNALMEVYVNTFVEMGVDGVLSPIDVANEVSNALDECKRCEYDLEVALRELFSVKYHPFRWTERLSRVWSSAIGRAVMKKVLAVIQECGGILGWIRRMGRKFRFNFLRALKEVDLDLAIKVIDELCVKTGVEDDVLRELVSKGRLDEAIVFVRRHSDDISPVALLEFAFNMVKAGVMDEGLRVLGDVVERGWCCDEASQVLVMRIADALASTGKFENLIAIAEKGEFLHLILIGLLAGGHFDRALKVLKRLYVRKRWCDEEGLRACEEALRTRDIKELLILISDVFRKYHHMDKSGKSWHSWFSGVVIPVFLDLGNFEGAVEAIRFLLESMMRRIPDDVHEVCCSIIRSVRRLMEEGWVEVGYAMLMEILKIAIKGRFLGSRGKYVSDVLLGVAETFFYHGFKREAVKMLEVFINLIDERMSECCSQHRACIRKYGSCLLKEYVTCLLELVKMIKGHLDDVCKEKCYMRAIDALGCMDHVMRGFLLRDIVEHALLCDISPKALRNIMIRALRTVGVVRGGKDNDVATKLDYYLAIGELLEILSVDVFRRAIELGRYDFFDEYVCRKLVEIADRILENVGDVLLAWYLKIAAGAYFMLTHVIGRVREVINAVRGVIRDMESSSVLNVFEASSLMSILLCKGLLRESCEDVILAELVRTILSGNIYVFGRERGFIENVMTSVKKAVLSRVPCGKRSFIEKAINNILCDDILRVIIALEIYDMAVKDKDNLMEDVSREILEAIKRLEIKLGERRCNLLTEGVRTILCRRGAIYTEKCVSIDIAKEYMKLLPRALLKGYDEHSLIPIGIVYDFEEIEEFTRFATKLVLICLFDHLRLLQSGG